MTKTDFFGENNEKIRRIAIDLDTLEIKKIIKCLKVIKRYGFTEEFSIKQSPSSKGLHITAWKPPHQGISKKKLLKIRKKAGDDRIRIMLDSKAFRMIQVLFTKKTKNKSDLTIDNIPMEYETCGEEHNVKVSYGET